MIEKGILGRFGKFASVGVVATAVHYAVLVGLVEVQLMAPVAASVTGYAISAVANYLLNFYLTFKNRAHHRHAAARFAVVAGVGFALNAGLMAWLTGVFAPYYLMAQIITTGLVLLSNFILNDIWSFKRREHAHDADRH